MANEKELVDLFEKNRVKFLALIRSLFYYNRGSFDEEDILQDSFLKAYTALDRFKGESLLYTWVYRIIFNNCLEKLRKKSHVVVDIDSLIQNEEGDVSPQYILSNPNQYDAVLLGEVIGFLDSCGPESHELF